MNRDNHFANMTAEQIRAAQLSHLTGDAQVAMANAYSGEKEAEICDRLQQKRSDDAADATDAAAEQQCSDGSHDEDGWHDKDTATGISGTQQSQQQQRINQLEEETDASRSE